MAPPAQLVPADQVAALVAGDVLFGSVQGKVRRRVGQVEQERMLIAPVAVHKGDRPVGERIGDVEVGILGRERAGEAPVVPPQPVVAGRLVHRFGLARPAHAGVEVVAAAVDQPPVAVEATVQGQFAGALTTVPFARHERAVTGVAQQLGEGDVVGAGAQPGAEALAHLVAVLAGEQRGTRGHAHGVVVEVGEAHAAGGQAVQVRGRYLAAVTAEVAETEVVGEDQDDVGAPRHRLAATGSDRGGRRRRSP